MKGWSVGFPMMLSLIKPEKDNSVKFNTHEGSSTAGSGLSKHNQDSVPSKTNPTERHCNILRQREHGVITWMVTTV